MTVLSSQTARRRYVGRSPRDRGPRFSPRMIVGAIVIIASILFLMRFLTPQENWTGSREMSVLITIEENFRIFVKSTHGHLSVTLLEKNAEPARPAGGVNFDLALTMDDLKRIVDAMGGILINIPETIEYPGPDGFVIRIESGMRRLDADRLEAYLKKPNSSKTASLRAIVIGVASRSSELEKEGVDLAKLLEAALPATEGESLERDAARLAALMRGSAQLGPAEIMIDWKEAKSRPVPKPVEADTRVIRVRILNGVGVPRLASRAAVRLRTPRYQVVETANADRFGYAGSLVVSPDAALAQETRQSLGIGRVENRPIASGADVEIILGADFRNGL